MTEQTSTTTAPTAPADRAAPTGGPGPWLSGYYAPVTDELDADDLPVQGRLPDGLVGTYLRNGANPRFVPPWRYHLFDGDGMLHGVTVTDGRASYRNRWIRSAGLAAEERAGRALYGGFYHAAMPPPELVGDAGGMKNTANTHVVRHAGRILALMEAAKPTEVNERLETLGEYDFGGRLRGAFSAHPKIDPVTGEMLSFSYVGPLTVHTVAPTGELVRSTAVELPAMVMMHDFAVTERHVVFLDAPAVFDLGRWLSGGALAAWEPERGTRLGVMPRDGDGADTRWFEIPTSWVAHFLNAYDDGDRVVVDGCRMDRLNFMMDPDDPPTGAEGVLTRFTIDLAAGRASFEALDDRCGDFPRVNDRYACHRHRYGYVAAYAEGLRPDGEFDLIVKYDLQRGTAETYRFGPGVAIGELVFAPDPEGRAEDDGWLVGFATDLGRLETDFVVLDARDVTAGPVARVRMPRRVPFGFHGSWLPAA